MASLHPGNKCPLQIQTFFLNDATSTPASAATASSLFLLASKTLRLRSRSLVRRHTSSCLGRRSSAKSRAHSGHRAMPLAGGPRFSDNCALTDCGRPTAGGARFAAGFGATAFAGAATGVRRRGRATGFCAAGGSLPALTNGFWTLLVAATVAAVTPATAAAAPAPAARALITVGCTTGGNRNLLVDACVLPAAGLTPPPLPLIGANGFFNTVAVLLLIRPVGRCEQNVQSVYYILITNFYDSI